jgi:hypothetical protein
VVATVHASEHCADTSSDSTCPVSPCVPQLLRIQLIRLLAGQPWSAAGKKRVMAVHVQAANPALAQCVRCFRAILDYDAKCARVIAEVPFRAAVCACESRQFYLT